MRDPRNWVRPAAAVVAGGAAGAALVRAARAQARAARQTRPRWRGDRIPLGLRRARAARPRREARRLLGDR